MNLVPNVYNTVNRDVCVRTGAWRGAALTVRRIDSPVDRPPQARRPRG